MENSLEDYAEVRLSRTSLDLSLFERISGMRVANSFEGEMRLGSVFYWKKLFQFQRVFRNDEFFICFKSQKMSFMLTFFMFSISLHVFPYFIEKKKETHFIKIVYNY